MAGHSKGSNAKKVVIGARVTEHEAAGIEILRGNLDRGTWVASLIRRELDKAKKDGRI